MSSHLSILRNIADIISGGLDLRGTEDKRIYLNSSSTHKWVGVIFEETTTTGEFEVFL